MPDTLRYITLQSGQHREHSFETCTISVSGKGAGANSLGGWSEEQQMCLYLL